MKCKVNFISFCFFKFTLSAGHDLIAALKWPFKTNCLEERGVGSGDPFKAFGFKGALWQPSPDPVLFKKSLPCLRCAGLIQE